MKKTNKLKKKRMSTKSLTLAAILTALVAVLQGLAVFLKIFFGLFAPSLVLIPIVIGTATCGKKVGAWLGFVFGAMVLLTGDAAAFLTVDVIGTILTVLVKGAACGFIAGLVYDLISKKNQTLAVISSAIVCPIVNTAVFLLGCSLFFMDTITQWAGGGDVIKYVFTGMIGINFVFELGLNVILSPIIVRIIKLR